MGNYPLARSVSFVIVRVKKVNERCCLPGKDHLTTMDQEIYQNERHESNLTSINRLSRCDPRIGRFGGHTPVLNRRQLPPRGPLLHRSGDIGVLVTDSGIIDGGTIAALGTELVIAPVEPSLRVE